MDRELILMVGRQSIFFRDFSELPESAYCEFRNVFLNVPGGERHAEA